MSTRPSLAGPPARILIVDDERQNRQLLELILEQEGYLVLSATNGEEALAIATQQLPDLILLDVMMPGMNGYEVAARLKASLPQHIPIIMLSALDDRSSRVHGLSVGAEDFLTKPLDRAELCLRVGKLLRVES